MGDNTAIEWTDATWNPITGCSIVSPGCTNCYAMSLAGTRLRNHPSRAGLTRASKVGPVWTGEVRLNEQWLDQPLRWARPRMIFVCAHGDLFHEKVPDEWIDRVFAVMALAPQHTFQVLTKRADRMRAYFDGCHMQDMGFAGDHWTTRWHRRDYVSIALSRVASETGKYGLLGKVRVLPLPNVWLGVSTEDQRRAEERIPDLLATPAAVRFLSAEPLLGPVDLHRIRASPSLQLCAAGRPPARIDWVIAGGESGPHARPSHPDWFRSLRDQCQAAGVPFFFKQWGEWAPWDGNPPVGACTFGDWRHTFTARGNLHSSWDPVWEGATIINRVGKARAGALLDGREWREMPR